MARFEAKRRHVLVTGGAGFVGSHLVDALIASGNSVIAIDDLTTGSIANLSSAISTGFCTFVYGDVNDRALAIDRLVRDAGGQPLSKVFHIVSHACSESTASEERGPPVVNDSVTGKLIELAIEDDATFVYASALENYEDALMQPWQLFNDAVAFGETAVALAMEAERFDGRIVRLFNCYGPRMMLCDGHFMLSALEALALGAPIPVPETPGGTRSMIYVGDAIAGLLFAAERPDRTCNPFRIGAIDTNGAPNPEDTRAEPQPVAGIGIPRRLGNIERFGEWVPKTNFEDGLRKTLDDRNR